MIPVLTPPQARALLRDADTLLYDLRPAAEYARMHLPKAECIAAAGLAAQLAAQQVPKSTPILLYCRVGLRSPAAAAELRTLGYTRAYSIGGIAGWPYAVIHGV